MNTDLKHATIIGAIATILAAIIVGLFGLFQGKYSYDAESVVHPQPTTIEDNSLIVDPQDTVTEKNKLFEVKIDTQLSTRRTEPKNIGFYSEQHQPETKYSWNSWKNTGSFTEKPFAGSSSDKFMRFTIGTNLSWFGFGLETEVETINVNDFEKGSLHFAIRHPEIMNCLDMLEIGIQSSSSTDKNMKKVNSWLPTSVAKCQSCNNNWNCCSVEIERFTKKEADLDLGSISQMIMLRCRSMPASASKDPVYLDVDDIYWSMP